MSAKQEPFESGLRQLHGTWPTRPNTWSFSSLKDVESCPKRWALAHAHYPSLWNGLGYPSRPSVAALTGIVLHGAMEFILTEFTRRNRAVAEPVGMVDVLRALGGLSSVLQSVSEGEIKKLDDNPRARPIIDYYRREMTNGLPESRQRLQGMLARTAFNRVSETRAAPAFEAGRGFAPLSFGSHPEVTLSAASLRLVGRADLMSLDSSGCVITDFKSGTADASHGEQLQLYALLWSLDQRLNPSKVPVSNLVVTYPWGSVEVARPSDREAETLLEAVAARIARADAEVESRPLAARPGPENCTYCSVRQMCDEYWSDVARQPRMESGREQFLDVEVQIEARNGTRSWLARRTADGTKTLLRTPDEGIVFESGDRLRLLGGFTGQPEPSGETAISLTRSSEVFICI